MEERVSFSVPFVAGLDRVRMSMRGGHPKPYDTKKNRANKASIRALYVQACEQTHGKVLKAPEGVPVRVGIDVYEPLPRSKPKRIEREHYTLKPDIDNIIKLVLDGLNGTAYADDKQVVSVRAHKHARTRYWLEPRTDIEITFPEGMSQ